MFDDNIIGWIKNSTKEKAVCLDCVKDWPEKPDSTIWTEVLVDSIQDRFPVCYECGEELFEVILTDAGIEFYKDWLWECSGVFSPIDAADTDDAVVPYISALSYLGVHINTVEEILPGPANILIYVANKYENHVEERKKELREIYFKNNPQHKPTV